MKYIGLIMLLAITLGTVALLRSYSAIDKMKSYDVKLEAISKLNKQYKAACKRYKKEQDSLKVITDSLGRRLAVTDSLLRDEKLTCVNYKVLLKHKIDEDWTVKPDSEKISECDSLKILAAKYMAAEDDRDSLSDDKAATLTEIVKQKDVVIDDCDSAYHAVSYELVESISDTQACQQEVLKLGKQVQHKTMLNKVLGTTTIVGASIVTAVLVLHH